MEIGGLVTKEDYGYDGEGETCKFNRSRVAARVTGGVEIGRNETQIAATMRTGGHTFGYFVQLYPSYNF